MDVAPPYTHTHTVAVPETRNKIEHDKERI